MKPEKPRGTKDFAPEEKITRQWIVNTLIKTFEGYGYSPFESSILEKLETLTAKYAGGEEIIKEIYKLKDQGKRDLGLRYDLTVPLAAFIGINPNIKMPFKRYEIGKVFRDGPIKLGRLREFWQCDVDVIGAKSILADAELLALGTEAFRKLGIKVIIKVNNIKLLNAIIETAQIKSKENVILSLDKLAKIGIEGVKAELTEKGLNKTEIARLIGLINLKGSNEEILRELKKKLTNKEGVNELEELFGYLKIMKVEATLEVSIARGLAYYTGSIYEFFAEGSEVTSSIAAGGRWDNMIPNFLETKKEYSAIGLSFGLEPISEVIKQKNIKAAKTVTNVLVIPIGTLNESIKIVQELRKNGIKADIDLLNRSPSKNLDFANSMKIPFVVFAGEEELRKNKVKLKNMVKGDEQLLPLKDCIKSIKGC